ncbi:MAG: RNA polymerase sigma factor [Gemmatimonadota bacterium]
MSKAAALRGHLIAGTDAVKGVVGPGSRESEPVDQPLTDSSDTELATRVQQGDAVAFDVLVGRHMQRAFSVALRLLGQRQDAEDLVQEAFLATLQKIDSFDTDREFSPWFYRILVNRCLNARKARSRRSSVDLPAETASSVASPLLETERSELRRHLTRALDVLPARQRTIVTMFDLEGFSSPEIAETLGISDGTVRWHLHQARRVLRKELEPFVRRKT